MLYIALSNVPSFCFFLAPPVSHVIGVEGYPVEMECDVQPTKRDDQLLLVLWYKEGHNSPIYT